MNNKTQGFKSASILVAYYILAVILIAGYVFIYQVAPFEGEINNTILNSVTALASLFAAVVSTVIFFHYNPEDHPRNVWLNIAFGCWFWFLSEAVWGVLYFNLGEVPVPSLADAGWVAGFIFFAAAIYHQYILILPALKNRIRNVVYAVWVVALAMPLITLSVMHIFTLENYINYFYPLADLAVGIAGLMLVYFFRGGMLMRPWLGMVIFGVSDFLYAWALQTGIYGWSVENGNLFSLIADTSYLFAYLFLTFGFISHWILIKYGLNGNHR